MHPTRYFSHTLTRLSAYYTPLIWGRFFYYLFFFFNWWISGLRCSEQMKNKRKYDPETTTTTKLLSIKKKDPNNLWQRYVVKIRLRFYESPPSEPPTRPPRLIGRVQFHNNIVVRGRQRFGVIVCLGDGTITRIKINRNRTGAINISNVI